MTLKTKNATIVFAFLSLLMAAPLTVGSAHAADDVDSSSSPICGFTTSNISLNPIVRGSEQAESAETTFQPTGGLNTVGGTFSVTAQTNFLGDGARSTASVAMAAVESGDTVTLRTLEYEALAGDQSGDNTKFSIDGSNEDVAESLALAINDRDTSSRATTSATDDVTITNFVRGTVGDSVALVSSDVTRLAITSGNAGFLDGGGPDDTTEHMDADNVRFSITKDGTTTSQGIATYTNKQAFNAKDTIKELEGATNIDKNLRLTLQTSAVPTQAAIGTVSIDAAVNVGDTVTVNGLVYTAIAGSKAGDNTKFDQSGADTVIATDLADSIENDSRIGLFGDLTATSGGTIVVTITSETSGLLGNSVGLAESTSAARMSVSGSTLGAGTGTLGAEPLRNLPYDGALKMTVLFTVNCS